MKNSIFNRRKYGVRILVVTGASGGHIFPALSFLDGLRAKVVNFKTLLVLPRKSIKNPIENFDCQINYISISPVKLRLDFINLFTILRFLKGSLESILIVLSFKPDIVVGFGSLVCIPIVLFARFFRIKTLIHEQNVIPGRANRFMAKFTDTIAISFAETKDYFKAHQRKIILTGNPLRKKLKKHDRKEALYFFGLNPVKFTILVMGGSSGSHRLNLGFLKAISRISAKHHLQLIHIAGLRDYEFLRNSYKNLALNLRLFSFLSDMQYAYSACDLIVSRAGATTIAEIIFYRLPAIIIPYPFAYKHQLANAKVLDKIGSAVIIQDSQLDTDILEKTIEDFIDNPDKVNVLRSYYVPIPDSSTDDLLVNEVLCLLK